MGSQVYDTINQTINQLYKLQTNQTDQLLTIDQLT